MPPSTFASAAASNSSTVSNQTHSRDGPADWARRTNGATQTFRRSSQPPSVSSTPSQDHSNTAMAPATNQHAPRYVPPHRNGPSNDLRYSKEQLLDLYRAQQDSMNGRKEDLSELYVGGWQPEMSNGMPSSGWGRTEVNRDSQLGPDACWDKAGGAEPLGLVEMDDEERELFTTSINTPLKPPMAKDGTQANGMPGRKASVSGSSGVHGLPSPSVTRNLGRRRETSESYPFPSTQVASPGGARDESRTASPPPSLLRRRTDVKENGQEGDADANDKPSQAPFGSLKRYPTGPLNTNFTAPASPWTSIPSSAGVAPMGSFGSFGLGSGQATPGEKRGGFGSMRAESRFKNVLNKDGPDENNPRLADGRATMASHARSTTGNESWRVQGSPDLGEDDDDLPSGSAALAASSEISPPQGQPGGRGFGTPNRSNTHEDYGFGAFGMTSDNAAGVGAGFLQGSHAFQQTPSAQRTAQQLGGHEPMSPTDTNPYQSPEQHGIDRLTEEQESDGVDNLANRLPGLGGFVQAGNQQFAGLGGLGAFGNLNRAPGAQGIAGDRSQTSSTGPSHNLVGLGGLGQFGNTPTHWQAPAGGFGTPGRQAGGISSAFGSGFFNGISNDLQSPSLGGLGATGILGSQLPGMGTGRGAGMFGQASAQDLHHANERSGSGERLLQGQASTLAELSHDSDSAFNVDAVGTPLPRQPGESIGGQASNGTDALTSNAAIQPPQPQQRTMVMPDRMRWIYRDPQGQTQGPWSGLEMHDWYKAGFFSPELLVKKYEDPEYEPLAQLIRRIGNSREPFLVPQIGIPHGIPSSAGPNAWAGVQAGNNANAVGGAQPPFASSFPSFGTTLTAEQQNALERRKQEEQYLMARQKEHLAQAQMAQRMHGHHGAGFLPGQLHHHSSAHSLHSQPSFGSIASPGGFAVGQIGSTNAGLGAAGSTFFDGTMRPAHGSGLGAVGAGVDSLAHIREEDMPTMMGRLDIGGSRVTQNQYGAPGKPFGQHGNPLNQSTHEQQVNQMLQDRARLQEEQDQNQPLLDDEQSALGERVQEFQRLQSQTATTSNTSGHPDSTGDADAAQMTAMHAGPRAQQESMSLTEQVQKAASAQDSPAVSLPQPFPPPPSQSPLPAPAAQRTGRQSFADHLQSESRDRSQTPSVDTPSVAVAPWAKEPAEAAKGPSLKEIQEAEAKKAAEMEEAASAARRAAFQRELEVQAATNAAAQPGLPASASWAAAGSPATPSNAASPWAKAAQKPAGPAPAKSMAQIQKEEEARKRRAAAQQANAQANAMAAVSNPAGGKSYANLAGKVGAPSASPAGVGGAWTTVGASSKTKPLGQAIPTPARTVSSSAIPSLMAPTVRKVPQRSTTSAAPGNVNAQEEFRKWATGELRPDLNKGISVDDFVNGLFFLPLEPEMITEAVHGVSNTIDSRHFAEEFIRRKKLADKGMIDTSAPPKSASPAHITGAQGGGWSEVAKKGPVKDVARGIEEGNGSFRVIAAKKKGGKR